MYGSHTVLSTKKRASCWDELEFQLFEYFLDSLCPFGPLWFSAAGETAQLPCFSPPLHNVAQSCHSEANRSIYSPLSRNGTSLTCVCGAVRTTFFALTFRPLPTTFMDSTSLFLAASMNCFSAFNTGQDIRKLNNMLGEMMLNGGSILTHLIVVKGIIRVFLLVLVKQQVPKFLQVFPFAEPWNAGIVPLKTVLLNHGPQSPLHCETLYGVV